MTTKIRSQKLLEIITYGLALYANRTTLTQLGNRDEYVGMSDLGSYMTCPRMAIMNKLHPQNLTHDRKPLLTMQRGHWFEDGIADALKTLELPLVRQLEIAVTHNGTPIKAHLDFVLASNHPRPTVRILEIKSCQKLPNCLYASYETQVYGQIGLLTRYWEEPVFSVREETGQYRFQDLTFSEIARHLWGLDLPYEWENVDIEAWVLCLSMTDAKVFGPYVSDAGMMDVVLKKAGEFWSTIQQIKDGTLDASTLKTTSGFNPLCEHCLWNADCPKFKGNDHPELVSDLEELAAWKSKRVILEEKIKARETSMKDWYANISGTQDGWIQAGHWRFKSSEIPGRRTLAKDSLAGELIELFHDGGMDDVDVPALIARHEKISAPSTRLFINKTSKIYRPLFLQNTYPFEIKFKCFEKNVKSEVKINELMSL